MKTNHLYEHLLEGKHLDHKQMQQMIRQCMEGALSDVQIAAFLVLMRMKGETVEELSAAALMMQQFANIIDLGPDVIDIVGTGGDGKNTFNVSTISSFVVAAAGVPVAKHGNYSVSSNSGSADLLLKAGFHFELTEDNLKDCIKKCGIAFLFAPHFHQAMRHARNARKQLGIRTLFNLLGPLINPARVKKQVVGVFSSKWLKPVASVLANLGSERALVIHSRDSMDEISICAPTDVVEYCDNEVTEWVIEPEDFGVNHPSLAPIVVNNPKESLQLAESVFAGEKGPARDIVVLNSAAALYCAGRSSTYSQAMEMAASAIDSGLAGDRFNQLKALTQRVSKSA